MTSARLRLIENNINVHAARAESNKEAAERFIELAEEDAQQMEYWIEEKREYLGGVALTDILPLPRVES